MAAIKCPHCGGLMYETLTECPHCRGPVDPQKVIEEARQQEIEAKQKEIKDKDDEILDKINNIYNNEKRNVEDRKVARAEYEASLDMEIKNVSKKSKKVANDKKSIPIIIGIFVLAFVVAWVWAIGVEVKNQLIANGYLVMHLKQAWGMFQF